MFIIIDDEKSSGTESYFVIIIIILIAGKYACKWNAEKDFRSIIFVTKNRMQNIRHGSPDI